MANDTINRLAVVAGLALLAVGIVFAGDGAILIGSCVGAVGIIVTALAMPGE